MGDYHFLERKEFCKEVKKQVGAKNFSSHEKTQKRISWHQIIYIDIANKTVSVVVSFVFVCKDQIVKTLKIKFNNNV